MKTMGEKYDTSSLLLDIETELGYKKFLDLQSSGFSDISASQSKSYFFSSKINSCKVSERKIS